MTTPTRRWARTDATQQRILDAATDVFSARGFSAATMADIVEHSGASIGSIYHHFGGKKELFLAIYDRLSADVELRDRRGRPRGRRAGQPAVVRRARAGLPARDLGEPAGGDDDGLR